MRIVLSTIGKFHTFDLARQLHQRQVLAAVFTGYPMFKLQEEGVPTELIRSFPWLQTFYMSKSRFGLTSKWLDRQLAWWSNQALGAYAATQLPECDIFMGLANTGLKTSRKVQSRGGLYICDRPCSHIRYQDRILREEFSRHGLRFPGVDPRIIAKEEKEYTEADAITVGSSFAKRSFIEMGISETKVHRIPYGVDLSRFYPVSRPDHSHFDVLFVGSASIRKGIPYLLESFAALNHRRKRLTIVGTVQPEVQPMIREFASRLPITCTGHQPQPKLKEIMSRSHVMVLPSIEEGLAMVQAQAMACGCPVIGTTNSGAEDLLQEGIEGFIVPIRDSATITNRLQQLADDSNLQRRLSAAALQRVESLGGWEAYGEAMINLFSQLISGNDQIELNRRKRYT